MPIDEAKFDAMVSRSVDRFGAVCTVKHAAAAVFDNTTLKRTVSGTVDLATKGVRSAQRQEPFGPGKAMRTLCTVAFRVADLVDGVGAPVNVDQDDWIEFADGTKWQVVRRLPAVSALAVRFECERKER